MLWDQSFEAYPIGDSYGSVSCSAIRALLSEFYSRLTKEHTLTEGASPIGTHVGGMAGVCNVTPDLPTSLGVLGALSYISSTGKLYIDDSTILNAISGTDHGVYTLNALLEDAHSQYLLYNPSAGYDTITGVVTALRVSGLDVIELDYSGYPGGVDSLIIPIGLHTGNDAVLGGARHDSNVIGGQAFKPGADKLKVSVATVFSGSLSDGTLSGEIDIGDYAFIPFLDTGTLGNTLLAVLPQIIDTGASFPSGAMDPKIALYNYSGFSTTAIVKRYRIDAV